ncbi:hypothetical protein ABI59_07470 [Acidobacteria bacterium Mor1]|nr:hypothetical protein ABI59_07470 [Acidobacteria bacterium Mor1]
MRRWIILLLVLVFAINSAPAKKKKKKDRENAKPIAWGTMAQNEGCVIFEESRKTKGKFWVIAVTTKTTGRLKVIETQNYTLEQTEWEATQESLDALYQLAVEHRLKLVKIPKKYTPEQLEAARKMCTEPTIPGTSKD